MTISLTEVQKRFLETAVKRAKAEIFSDIASGIVPATIKNFAELHDYVDGNCYAGACEESTENELRGLDRWNSVFPRRGSDEDEVLGSEATLEAMNEMLTRLDQWLVSGKHHLSGVTDTPTLQKE
jgi:hypothetical protein